MNKSIKPSEHSLEEFIQKFPDQGPLVMLNLLKFRERASYPESMAIEAMTGREAYKLYSRSVAPILESIGARVIWMGQAHAAVIAPDAESWEEVFLVEYPSKAAFLQMIASQAYKNIVMHRMAALDDSRLIATTPTK